MQKKGSVIIIVFLFLFSVNLISAYGYDTEGSSDFGYDTEVANYLKKGGDTTTGDYLFNGGWEDGGLSIINGSIYGQLGFFYNITSLNITKQDLTITENLDVLGNTTADYFFGERVVHDGDEDTYIDFLNNAIKLVAGGTSTIYASSSMMEINNEGIDYDLRFRGLNDDALFYLNAGTDRIGIGTSSPSAKLQIGTHTGTIPANTGIWVTGPKTIRFGSLDNNAGYGAYIQPAFEGTGTERTTLKLGTRYGAVDKVIMTLKNSGNVGIGTITPQQELNVIGNGNFTGNVTAENVWIPQYAFAYTNTTIPVAVSGDWYNVTFDEEEYTTTQGITHTYNDATNHSFYITQAGTYEVFGTVSIIDTSVNAEDHIMIYRTVKNGVEIHGSLWEGDFSRADASSKRNWNVMVDCSVGDTLGLQFTGDDTNIKLFPRDSTGYGTNHPHSAIIKIKRVA